MTPKEEAENDEYEVWFKSLIIELNNMKKD